MIDKYEKMLEISFELDRRDDNNLIAQMEGLESLYNHQDWLHEDEQKRYQRMCEKVGNFQLLEGDDLVLLKYWKNRLKELESVD